MKTKTLLLALAIATLTSCRKEPVACFSTDPDASGTIYIGEEISFTNCSANEQTAVWNFGDGNTSSERSPKHTYAVQGEYTVTLAAYSKGDMKKDVATMVLSIDTLPIPPQLSDTLIAYYPFNGNADDESGNGNDGTLSGVSLTVDKSGNMNSAYYFDGVDDHIIINGFTNEITNDITLSAWVMLPPIYTGGKNCAIMSGKGGIMLYVINNEFVIYEVGTGGSIGVTNTVVADNTWHHVAYVRNGNAGTLYVDGAEKSTHIANYTSSLTDYLVIGKSHKTYNWDMVQGTIDEVRIYNIALSASEILELYQE